MNIFKKQNNNSYIQKIKDLYLQYKSENENKHVKKSKKQIALPFTLTPFVLLIFFIAFASREVASSLKDTELWLIVSCLISLSSLISFFWVAISIEKDEVKNNNKIGSICIEQFKQLFSDKEEQFNLLKEIEKNFPEKNKYSIEYNQLKTHLIKIFSNPEKITIDNIELLNNMLCTIEGSLDFNFKIYQEEYAQHLKSNQFEINGTTNLKGFL